MCVPNDVTMGSACSSAASTSIQAQGSSVHSHSPRRRGHSLLADDEDSSSVSYYDSGHSRTGASGAEMSPPEDIFPSSPTVISMAPPVARRPTPVDPKLSSLSEFPVAVRKMLCGRMDAQVTMKNKVITIFHLPSFLDSCFERINVYQKVYPRLQNYCACRGFVLRVVDVFLGMRDEFQFGHSASRFCAKLLKQLSQEDKHLITTVFLNERYGVYWCPPCICADDLANVMKKMPEDDRTFLLLWYQLDPLRTDRSYMLQPIEVVLPKYRNKCTEGAREWEKVSIRLRNILTQAGSQEFQKKYFISNIEYMLNESVLSDCCDLEKVVWLRRTFTSMYLTTSSSANFAYVDTVGDRVADFAQNRLKHMITRLSELVPPENCLHSEVPWNTEGLDLNKPAHSKYAADLCNKYEEMLKAIIDVSIQERNLKEIEEKKMLHRGFTGPLYNDLLHTTILCQQQSLSVPTGGRESIMQALEEYISTGYIAPDISTNHPLVLYGPPGCGLTSLAACLAANACSIDGWTGSVCVMRLGGGAVDARTWQQLLEGVILQLCLIVQIKYKDAIAQGGDSPLSWLFPRVSPITPLLVVLDGMERLNSGGMGAVWIPTDLPGHVRMLITATTGSEWFAQLQNQFPGGDNFIDAPLLEDVEVVEILDDWMSQMCCRLPESTVNDVLASLSGQATPVVAHLVGAILSVSDLEEEPTNGNRIHVNGDVDGLVETLLEKLEERLGTEVIEAMMTMITCSHHGVGDVEMEELLSCKHNCMKAVSKYFSPELDHAPPYLWYFVKDLLHPFLLHKMIGGIAVVKWAHAVFDDVVLRRYATSRKVIVNHMLSYYDGHFSKGSTSWVYPHKLKHADFYNVRKLTETPHLLFLLKQTSRLMTSCLFDWRWLSAKLTCTNFYYLLHDMGLCEQVAPTDLGLVQMAKLMQILRYQTIETPMQFSRSLSILAQTNHISVDQKLHPLLKQFYDDSMRDRGDILWPDDKSCLGQWNSKSPDSITGMFRIATEPAHMIATSMGSGTVRVVNVFTRDVVRTIHGLEQPKNVKMCAAFKAVLLCNRELRVVDLDHGKLLAKLKGVLNIKMPYYGVHDQMNTIALARNRMYVNMMNNASGDLVTTFKVGEDRFLDSLLVSRNGHICVCGDAVQKPFPLLVWDLLSRKLIYDLRIQGHEFLTRMADITHAGQFVVCVSRELDDPDPSSIIVYDLQSGSVFKKWRPDYSVTCVAINSASSLIISGHEDGSVCVWDLVGGKIKYKFVGHTRGPDRLSVCEKGWRVASYDSTGRDTAVWAWDLQTGKCLGSFPTLSGVHACEISADGTLLVVGLPGCEETVVIQLPGTVNVEAANLLFGDPIRAGESFNIHN